MNYIKQLQEKNAALEAQLKEVNNDLSSLMTYLNGTKFQGTENNWVSATEMMDALRELRMKTLTN